MNGNVAKRAAAAQGGRGAAKLAAIFAEGALMGRVNL
jgi:hypothetical protein